MATVAELRTLHQESQAKWLRLDGLVNEAYQCLVAAREHQNHGRDGEASILVDAALRILATYTEEGA